MSNPVMPGERTRKLKYGSIAEAAASGAITIASAKEGGKAVTFAISDIPASLKNHIILFGVKNLVSDRVAHIEDANAKITAMSEIWENIKKGEWSEKRSAGETEDGLNQTAMDFVTAASILLKKPVEQLTGALLALDPAARKSYIKEKSAHSAIKAHLATIAAERAKEKAKTLAKTAKQEDVAFSLDDLEGEGEGEGE